MRVIVRGTQEDTALGRGRLNIGLGPMGMMGGIKTPNAMIRTSKNGSAGGSCSSGMNMSMSTTPGMGGPVRHERVLD